MEAAACSPSEVCQLRQVLGGLSFLARENRPDLSAPMGLLQGRLPDATIGDLAKASRIVRVAWDFDDVSLPISAIPPKAMSILAFGDESFRNAQKKASQAGQIVLAADRSVLNGLWCEIGVLGWRSHKMKRLVESAPAAEVVGMSKSMA